jgi:hypothetical protein
MFFAALVIHNLGDDPFIFYLDAHLPAKEGPVADKALRCSGAH